MLATSRSQTPEPSKPAIQLDLAGIARLERARQVDGERSIVKFVYAERGDRKMMAIGASTGRHVEILSDRGTACGESFLASADFHRPVLHAGVRICAGMVAINWMLGSAEIVGESFSFRNQSDPSLNPVVIKFFAALASDQLVQKTGSNLPKQ